MTISIEMFYLVLFLFGVAGGVGSWRYSEKRYDRGFLDAIQLHNQGRLTYTSYFNDEGIEILDIEVSPYED